MRRLRDDLDWFLHTTWAKRIKFLIGLSIPLLFLAIIRVIII